MARLVVTERFIQDTDSVTSARVLDRIDRALRAIETFPESGSPDVPPSVAAEFGEGVRKVVVAPTDIVYEYDRTSDTAFVHGLIPCAMAR